MSEDRKASLATRPKYESVLVVAAITSYTFPDFLQICNDNVKSILPLGGRVSQADSAHRTLESSGREVYAIRY
jgi:hypothetical protein